MQCHRPFIASRPSLDLPLLVATLAAASCSGPSNGTLPCSALLPCPGDYQCDIAQNTCWKPESPDGSQVPRTFSQIEVDPAAPEIEVGIGSMEPGETTTFVLKVFNTGSKRDLTIQEITLQYTPPAGAQGEDPPAFRILMISPQAIPMVLAPLGEGTGDDVEQMEMAVVFQRPADELPREAVLTIRNDSSRMTHRQAYTVRFKTAACAPTLAVPATLDLGFARMGEPAEKVLQVMNTGNCDLEIDRVRFEGTSGFQVTIGEAVLDATDSAEDFPQLPPLRIAANASEAWPVRYTAASGEPAEARLTLFSNDASAPAGTVVEMTANRQVSALSVVPNPIEFGAKMVGQSASIAVEIRSVGSSDSQVRAIRLQEGASADFSLDFSTLSTGQAPQPDVSSGWLTMAPGTTESFAVRFVPDTRNPLNGRNQPIPDTATIVLESDSPLSPLEIQVSGFGVEAACPTPVIVVEEGEEVDLPSTLHLHGEQSDPTLGAIASYAWSVHQPVDNLFGFSPSSAAASPTHQVNVAGQYTYCLDVCDAGACSSDASCGTTACREVLAIHSTILACELTWRTPDDPDEFDEGLDAGSDLDLHLAHPDAGGPDLDGDGRPDGWFDIPHDVFFYNPNPEWGSTNPNMKDNPDLVRDDTDGAGPEIVHLDLPESGRVYRLGVHYWDDHGFDIAYPRVKCYVCGELVFDQDLENLGTSLRMCDLWEVATFEWPSGKVTAVTNATGDLKITNRYQNPDFPGMPCP